MIVITVKNTRNMLFQLSGRNPLKYGLFSSLFFVLMATAGTAQDSTKKSIDITSSFKPSIRESAKINFIARPPLQDTARPALTYTVPSSLLLLNYQPTSLKPLSLVQDSIPAWDHMNYIKAGIGNFHQPFIKAGFSLASSNNKQLNFYADHYIAKGKLDFQKNNLTKVGVYGTALTEGNKEWSGKLAFANDLYFLYGYLPSVITYSKDQLRQPFRTWEGMIRFQNKVPTPFGLTYDPSLQVNLFSNTQGLKANEANTVLNLPLTKYLGPAVDLQLSFNADLTRYQLSGEGITNSWLNNIYSIGPKLNYKSANVFIQAGIKPSWDNGVFHMLPNLMADISTSDRRFTFQLGWIGYFQKGSYQRLAGINPWLAKPIPDLNNINGLPNTRVEERFAGFKGSLDKHFSYSAKAGFLKYSNVPLFVNDKFDGKTFLIIFEPGMQALQLHGELMYVSGETFNAYAKLNWNQYSKLKQEAKAWGLLPLELNGGFRWMILKDLWLRTDLWAWSGPQFKNKFDQSFRGSGGFDLNTGVEFQVSRHFNFWMQLNNILNGRNERWSQYQSYGFHFLGGITYSFSQEK
jgi:hypothetical protein